jgi:hypothetical protein
MRFTSIQLTSSVTTSAPSNRQCAATTSVTIGTTSVRSSAAPRATRGRGTLPRKTTRATLPRVQAQRSVQPEPRPPPAGSAARARGALPGLRMATGASSRSKTRGPLATSLPCSPPASHRAPLGAPHPDGVAASGRERPRPRHTRRSDARATRYPGAYRAEPRPSVRWPSAPSASSSRKGFRTAKS